MLSTFYSDSMIERSRTVPGGIETIKKPHMVEDYNKHMGGVDMSDQFVLYYGYAHRNNKWWKRVFFHLLDLCIVNAHILYNLTTDKPLPQFDFGIAVVAGL